jgi:hypothetical protein
MRAESHCTCNCCALQRAQSGRMEDHEPNRFERLWRWLRPVDRDEQYLAAATDHADLERRMRAIERRTAGPPFVTFNH